MSARAHGAPLWWCRPTELVDGAVYVPLDDEGHAFAGTYAEMDRHIMHCEMEDGRQWAATEIEQ